MDKEILLIDNGSLVLVLWHEHTLRVQVHVFNGHSVVIKSLNI